jgi:hypothetical protein
MRGPTTRPSVTERTRPGQQQRRSIARPRTREPPDGRGAWLRYRGYAAQPRTVESSGSLEHRQCDARSSQGGRGVIANSQSRADRPSWCSPTAGMDRRRWGSQWSMPPCPATSLASIDLSGHWTTRFSMSDHAHTRPPQVPDGWRDAIDDGFHRPRQRAAAIASATYVQVRWGRE